MREILPGLFHWTTFRSTIGADVSSYYVEPARIVVDPLVPDEGLEAFAGHAPPEQVVLTTGLHDRHAQRFADAFGCPIRVSREGQERLGGALDTVAYGWDEDIAPGVTTVHVDVLCPDEGALHIAIAEGAIAFADGLHRDGGALGFFSDDLLGDDPAAIKDGLRERFRALLRRDDFDHLLFAHGDPLIGDGRAALRAFAG